MSTVVKHLAKLMTLAGAFTLVPALASVFLGEMNYGKYFLLVGIPAIVTGLYVDRRIPHTEVNMKDALTVAALGWLLVPLLGAVPFVLALDATPLDAYFESMSGFTTTGLSVFKSSELPRTFIFWRSFSQWVGGIGVILLFLAVVGPSNIAAKLYAAEGRTERLEPSISRTVDAIFFIYTYLTLIGILLLYLAGSDVFKAVNITMTTLATGGFSPFDDSFAASSVYEKAVVILLMFAGAVSFAVHQRWMNRDYMALIRNPEVRLMAFLIVLFSVFLYLGPNSMIDSVFQATSAITSTGLSTVPTSSLNDHSIYFLTLLMITGGGYGSTSGALKLVRVLVILKVIQWYIRKITVSSRTVVPLKFAGKPVSEDEALATMSYSLLYIAFLLIGVTVFVLLDHPLSYSVFEVASAQGNVGLSVIAAYTPIEKLTLMFHMWVGRLEIIPLLAFIADIKLPRIGNILGPGKAE